MPISRQQICMLQEGDVLFFEAPAVGRCYTAVLERNGSKLVLSLTVDQIKCIPAIRNPQWEYLVVDEVGSVCDKDGEELTEVFLVGEILIGRALGVAHKYRSRIMPNMKLLREGQVMFSVDSNRKRDVDLNISRIQDMVFNDDYKGNFALMTEMFARIVKNVPHQELPIYLSQLLDTINSFLMIQRVTKIHDAISAAFSFSDEEPLGDEVQEAIRNASSKKTS